MPSDEQVQEDFERLEEEELEEYFEQVKSKREELSVRENLNLLLTIQKEKDITDKLLRKLIQNKQKNEREVKQVIELYNIGSHLGDDR